MHPGALLGLQPQQVITAHRWAAMDISVSVCVQNAYAQETLRTAWDIAPAGTLAVGAGLTFKAATKHRWQ